MISRTTPLRFFITICLALVWLINGLGCKVFNLIPRHRQIVATLLGEDIAVPLTTTIGILETCMAVWILSGIKSRWCAIVQVVTVITMNIIEYLYVPELLLWGHFNLLFAILFSGVILVHEFILPTSKTVLKHGDS